MIIEALDSSSVKVSWNPPQFQLQNGIIVDYILQISGEDTAEDFEFHSFEEFVTVFNLHPFYTYTFTIAAVTIDVGPYSPAVAFQMPEEGCHC